MISQKDIARKLDVSTALVCRVLSGRMGTTRVAPVLRNKIIRAADSLGYLSNNARGLYSGKSGTIAIFIKPWGVNGTEYVQTMLNGIFNTLQSTKYHTWLCLYWSTRELERKLDIGEIRNRVDGLLIGGVWDPKMAPMLRKLEKARIPVVSFFESGAKSHIPNVSVDPREQGRLATEHLIARGCRRIAHFPTHALRAVGYRQALRTAGLAYDPRLVVEPEGFEIDHGHRGARELLARNVPFDGLFASSDCQAYGAMQEILQSGIRIPEDVKIIGVDDSPLCRTEPIMLSSVTSECRTQGEEVVDMMNRKLAGEKVDSRHLMPHVIQRRSS